MKNFITKIIGSAMLATFLIVPGVSFATTFNDASNDLPTLRAGNYTKNPNQDALTWTTSASADAGDTVNLAVYYHNTGSDTARNVRISLSPQTTSNGTTQTFTASVSADNTPTVLGSATFSLSSDQTVSFNGNTAWRPNRATSGSTSFPSGQSGYDLFSSQGVNIGDIAPGWDTQGNIFISFKVSSTTVSTPPSVSTNSATNVTTNGTTLNGYMNGNGVATNAWFEYGTTSSFGNTTSQSSYGTGSSNYTAVLSNLTSNTTYYFRAVAQNTQGTVYGSTYSFTTMITIAPRTVVIGGTAPVVTTLLATEIVGDIAKLNGLIFVSSGQSSSAWFEWGTTTSLGNKTGTFNVGALPSIRHSDMLTGLSFGQKYYYRVVAENIYGKTYGAIMSFTVETSDTNVVISTPRIVTRVVTTPVTRVATTPFTLTLDGGAETITPKEKRTYRVSWKNESMQDFKNVVLRVMFPQAMTVQNADKGVVAETDNSVVLEIGTFAKGTGGEISIVAMASNSLAKDELVVVTANMVYTDASGIQGDAVAYVTQYGVVEQSQVASIFGAGILPTTILGWALLLVLVLVLVLIGNILYGRMVMKV